ncbi:sodium:solute symporter [Flammeovirga sp. SubArs3]|uniref:sodium:solute symporter n=1 Tax=Flammeovirga sp. SubArs3 TaxID=2995316 RepID=UPI00248C1A98|nr:sodium:solute symporter [Flammeovirga sp. SubArs3]
MIISPLQSLTIFTVYVVFLFLIAYLSSRKSTAYTFFNGNKNSPWYAVAYGMIGTTLSGVTFISLPGMVKAANFSYLQVCFGYILGYFVIAYVLMPIYYNRNLISIYGYLEERFNTTAYKTGSSFFLVSRALQAAGKLFIMATVLQTFIYEPLGISYIVNTAILLLIISLYTLKGGIKTVVWTDTVQTTFMLAAAIITIYIISNVLDSTPIELMYKAHEETSYTTIFNWDINSPGYFWKQFISGAFLAIVMTGLDQDMMQKNLTIKTLKKAQLNMVSFSFILFVTFALFLCLGAILYLYTDSIQFELPKKSDQLYPLIAQHKLGILGASIFLLGVIASAFSSADSAITSLTTAFCVDFLKFGKGTLSEENMEKTKKNIHFLIAFILFVFVISFDAMNNSNAMDTILKLASFTYGPLLGLFSFGIFMKEKYQPRWIPITCLVAPILCYLLQTNSSNWFNGYKFGYEILLLNGLLTFLGLWVSCLIKPNKNAINS